MRLLNVCETIIVVMYKFAYVYVRWGQSYFEVALKLFLIYFLVFQLIMFKRLENISSNQMRRNI